MNFLFGLQFLLAFSALINAALTDPIHNKSLTEPYTPTRFPADPFYPETDVETLHEALHKKSGADEKTIIDILTLRSNEQCVKIAKTYQRIYDHSLIIELGMKLHGNLKDLILTLMTPRDEYYVKELHDAVTIVDIKKYGYNIKVDVNTIEALYRYLTDEGRQHFEKLYKQQYQCNLMDDMKTYIPRMYREKIQSETPDDYYKIPDHFAEMLHRALSAEKFDRRGLTRIIVTRSELDLQNIKQTYNEKYGKPLHQAISDALKKEPDYDMYYRAFKLFLG